MSTEPQAAHTDVSWRWRWTSHRGRHEISYVHEKTANQWQSRFAAPDPEDGHHAGWGAFLTLDWRDPEDEDDAARMVRVWAAHHPR